LSKTSNRQHVDLPRKSLREEETADMVREKIRQKNIIDASQLFQQSASGLEKDDREILGQQLSALIEQAEKYFREAGSLERERKLEEAREKYKEVENIAIDYPELSEAFRRIDDAVALIWALQQRDKRRMNRPEKQSSSPETPYKTRKSKGSRLLLVCFFLPLLMVGVGLFYTDKLNFTLLKKKSVLQVSSAGKEERPEEKDSVRLSVNKKDEQSQKRVLFEELGDKQQNRASPGIGIDQKESLPSVQDYPEQSQQSIPVIGKQDGSGVELFSREKFAEHDYTVQSGDTLGLISMKVYGTFSKWPVIANANKDQLKNNPDRLRVGITLTIPTLTEAGDVLVPHSSSTFLPVLNEDGTYTVQFGDSLSTIAQKLFGNSGKWRQIYELNRDVLTPSHRLKVGQILRVKAPRPDEQNDEKSSGGVFF